MPQARPTAPLSWPGPPPPIGHPSPAMPAEHGVRLDDEERVRHVGNHRQTRTQNRRSPSRSRGRGAPTLQYDQLLTQAQILDDQVRSGFRPRRDRSPRPPDHPDPPPSVPDLPGVFHRAGQKERTWIEFLRPTWVKRKAQVLGGCITCTTMQPDGLGWSCCALQVDMPRIPTLA
jgi:hypothetical protein